MVLCFRNSLMVFLQFFFLHYFHSSMEILRVSFLNRLYCNQMAQLVLDHQHFQQLQLQVHLSKNYLSPSLVKAINDQNQKTRQNFIYLYFCGKMGFLHHLFQIVDSQFRIMNYPIQNFLQLFKLLSPYLVCVLGTEYGYFLTIQHQVTFSEVCNLDLIPFLRKMPTISFQIFS